MTQSIGLGLLLAACSIVCGVWAGVLLWDRGVPLAIWCMAAGLRVALTYIPGRART